MRKILTVLSLMLIVTAVTANCGGGGGTNGTHPAVLKLSTTGEGTIGAIDVIVQLLDGVTFHDAAPSGVGAASSPLFAVNAQVPGRVRIAMITVNGFGAGEFCTMNCDIVSGSTPTATDFPIVQFKVTDVNGIPLDGMAPAVSVEMH